MLLRESPAVELDFSSLQSIEENEEEKEEEEVEAEKEASQFLLKPGGIASTGLMTVATNVDTDCVLAQLYTHLHLLHISYTV